MTERGTKMVVDRSAIKHRFAERTTTIGRRDPMPFSGHRPHPGAIRALRG
jgi:hypothetical protein